MTALPPFSGSGAQTRRLPPRSSRFGRGWGIACLLACAIVAASVSAHAQVSGSITLQSDYIVRGHAVSAGKPAALLNLSYDNPSGLYANGSAIFDLDAADNPALLGAIANIGYAHPLTELVSVDGGVIRTQYHQLNGAQADAGYTEGYVGLVGRNASARVYYSPDYYANSIHTVYGEIEGHRQVWAGMNVGAHVGYLSYLACPGVNPRCSDQYDWRVTASRPIQSFVLFVAVSGGGPGRDYYLSQLHSKTVLMGGVSWAF